jgi:hypothetical protein
VPGEVLQFERPLPFISCAEMQVVVELVAPMLHALDGNVHRLDRLIVKYQGRDTYPLAEMLPERRRSFLRELRVLKAELMAGALEPEADPEGIYN